VLLLEWKGVRRGRREGGREGEKGEGNKIE
jgi:hypothetical protein